MLTEMNQLPPSACLTKTLVKGGTGDSGEKIAQDLNSKRAANRAVVTQSPASLYSTSASRQKTVIDPNTGEILRASEAAGTGQAAPEETGKLKGLFGTTTSAQTADDATAAKQVMQEKMLWGSRPTIR